MTDAIVGGKTLQYDRQTNTINAAPIGMELHRDEPLIWTAAGQDRRHKVVVHNIDAPNHTVIVSVNGKKAVVRLNSRVEQLLRRLGMEGSLVKKLEALKAPMPGLIHSVLVKPGDKVAKGDPLLILVAMKMENVIKAGGDGTVEKVMIKEGASVEKGAQMITFA
jgi:biotin carboxyl carrier protein